MTQPLSVGGRRLSPRASRPLLLAVAAVAVLALVGVYALASRAGAPAGACADERSAGYAPALEARIPRSLEGRPPDSVDSGRNCSPDRLGTLASRHGLTSVTFAGGTWLLGASTGVTLSVFEGATAEQVAELYRSGAEQARKVTGLRVSTPTVGGRRATRLEYSDGDSPQAIVVWPSADGAVVDVVLAAGVPDRIVTEAIDAFERPG